MFYDLDVLPPSVKPTQLTEPDDKKHMSEITISQMSPKAQMSHGIDSADIQCGKDLTLVMKNSDGSLACVKPTSVEKLIQRGWASQF